MSLVDSGICDFPSEISELLQLKRIIIKSLWGRDLSDDQLQDAYEFTAFFSHYRRQATAVPSRTFLTHRHILETVNLLGQVNLNRKQVKAHFLRDHANDVAFIEDNVIDDLIDVAVSLWLMVFISNPRLRIAGVWSCSWNDSETLKDVMSLKAFSEQKVEGRRRLPAKLNAYHLENIVGIQIFWTDCLADHLSMKDDDTRLVLFHHAAFLQCLCNSKIDTLPTDLFTETLETLLILLPPTDKYTQRWYARQVKLAKAKAFLDLDPLANKIEGARIVSRRIDHFHFWGERLDYLLQVYQDHEPRTLRQWARDDRRPAQAWTFWIATFAFLIATFSLIAAILQTWSSIGAYKLALAQAQASTKTPP